MSAPTLYSTIYDAITSFQATAKLSGLQHAQIRGHLTEHLATALDAERVAHRATVLAEAVSAARTEYLTEQTGTAEDEAYNQGVTDAVAAIGALLEGGPTL